MIEASGVVKVFAAVRGGRGGRGPGRRPERRALDGAGVRVAKGEVVALLGHNGSGKSTLLSILCGLLAADAGTARVEGTLGVAFQSPALDGLLTVRENLRLAGRLCGVAAGGLDGAVEQAARAFGVEDRLDDRVKTLSGGLARRADLARAVLHGPSALIVDEPTAGLDPEARPAAAARLRGLARERNAAVLWSTHDAEEAVQADRVVMLAGGRVVADETPAALLARLPAAVVRAPAGDQARRVLGTEARAEHDVVSASFGDVRAAAEAVATLAAAGVAVRFERPTLAEAYRVIAGTGLAEGSA
jgi:ABC-2 type transport system ATP-binding protein